MAVKQILERHWEGLSGDPKPTGVIAGTTFRETDTRANYITYNGDDWEVADIRYRLVNEDGTYVDIPGEFETLVEAIDAIGSVVALQVEVVAIRAVTDAEPVLEETGGTLTTDGNEQIVYVNESPAGVFRPMCLKIDVTAQTATETIVVKEYYRIAPGGGYDDPEDEVEYVGAIAAGRITIHFDPNRYGVKVTMQKTAGTNRAYPWEVFREVAP